jgi:hypothetical protein
MDFELAVMQYICTDLSTFVIPQFRIEEPKWFSCPDFLALNPKTKVIYLVEVTTAANPRGLATKVIRMFQPGNDIGFLRDQLRKHYPAQGLEEWPVKVAAFVRRDARDGFDRLLTEGLPEEKRKDVTVLVLEKCVFPWEYWDRITCDGFGWDHPRSSD